MAEGHNDTTREADGGNITLKVDPFETAEFDRFLKGEQIELTVDRQGETDVVGLTDPSNVTVDGLLYEFDSYVIANGRRCPAKSSMLRSETNTAGLISYKKA